MRKLIAFGFLISLLFLNACKNETKSGLDDSEQLVDSLSADTIKPRRVPDPPTAEQLAVSNSLMSRLMRRDSLSNFTRLLVTAELAERFLKGEGEYTIFAPTNKAFEQMDQEALQQLVHPNNKEQLQQLLMAHIVPVQIDQEQLSGLSRSGQAVVTLAGSSLTIRKQGAAFQLRTADGLRSSFAPVEVEASNGFLYMVDRVLDSDR